MTQQEFDLNKLLKALWRFKWLIALLVLVAAGTAWGFISAQPTVYEAKATVMVESGQQSTAALPAGLEGILQFAYRQDLGSQIQVMTSRSVLERAVTQLEPDKVKNPGYLQLAVTNLGNSLKVNQVGNTSLVAVTVVSTDPVKAQRQANAVAESYVYEIAQIKMNAIETALENTTKQLKELNANKLDLSISPFLPPITAQIDIVLADLRSASERAEKIGTQLAAESPDESIIVVKDAGTVLTPLQLGTISQLVEAANDEAEALSLLAQRLDWQSTASAFNGNSLDIAVFESRTRAMATRIGALSEEVEARQRVEIEPQVQSQLLTIEEQLKVTDATMRAILDQVLSLYSVEEQLRAISGNTEADITKKNLAAQAEANLMRRIVQHTALVATTLENVSGQLQQIQPRASTLKQWELQNLIKTLRERLSEGTDSVTFVLDNISKELRPQAPEKGLLLTRGEITYIQNNLGTATATLAFLLSEVEKLQLDELEPQVYSELLSVREWLRRANDTAGDLPEQIAALEAGGGDNLGSAALDNLRQQLQLQLLTSGSGGSRVMDEAVVSSPTTTLFGRLRSVILAAVAALLIGVLGVLVLQYFDRRVSNASQVTSFVGLPVLASVAMVKGAGNPHLPLLSDDSPPQYLEAFRMLRTNLDLDSSRGQVILVSSPVEGEGKTTVAANLARAVSLQGRRVLLIDGNLRKPGIAAAFELTEADGLSEFLAGEKEPQEYITKADGVDILPVEVESAKSAEALSSPRMKELLEKARQAYDVVIVDSAPVTGYADTRILAKETDAVLLVLQAGVSMLDLARDSKQALETIGGRVVGFVLNKEKSNAPR